MTGEPDSFIELGVGRRLMVLAQRDGACRLLGSDGLCGSYAARPRDCQAFPFDFGLPPVPANVRRLALLPLEGCELAAGGEQNEVELRATDDARWSELAEYRLVIARWNRRAFHKKRLGRSAGTAREFLALALAEHPTRS